MRLCAKSKVLCFFTLQAMIESASTAMGCWHDQEHNTLEEGDVKTRLV